MNNRYNLLHGIKSCLKFLRNVDYEWVLIYETIV